jgi:hypothetical protein
MISSHEAVQEKLSLSAKECSRLVQENKSLQKALTDTKKMLDSTTEELNIKTVH